MQNKENVKRTLVVNLFAQPGAGKSRVRHICFIT